MIAHGWTGLRASSRLPRVRIPRPRLAALVGIAVLVGLLGGVWLWLRDSSLVAVQRVTVTDVTGPDAARIRSALKLAARNMTTLDVKTGALDTAVAPYPVVKSLRISTQFPHGMRIRVIEQAPVGEIAIGGRTVAVASDGTILHDGADTPRLPTIMLRSQPVGSRITDPTGLDLVALLGNAPGRLLSKVAQVSSSSAHGLVAQLLGGPSVYFGDAEHLAAKWTAAAAVLADSGSASAEYVDVTDPKRPAAGAISTAAQAPQQTSPAGAAPEAAAATAGG